MHGLKGGRWGGTTDANRDGRETFGSALDVGVTDCQTSGLPHTDTLRRAERDGLISRHLDPERVETATLYDLTDLGRSIDEPLDALCQWVDANWGTVEAAHRRWAARTES